MSIEYAIHGNLFTLSDFTSLQIRISFKTLEGVSSVNYEF